MSIIELISLAWVSAIIFCLTMLGLNNAQEFDSFWERAFIYLFSIPFSLMSLFVFLASVVSIVGVCTGRVVL